jgi:hypothetical protein
MEQSEEQEPVSTITHIKRRKKLQAQSNKSETQHKKMYGVRTNAILMALEQYGPQSRAELELSAGIPKELIAAVVSRLNRPTPRLGKQIHIVRYVYDSEGARRYPRAVYAIGDGKDVPKPKPCTKENKRRYANKLMSMYKMNSVFNLGKTRDMIRAERRAA